MKIKIRRAIGWDVVSLTRFLEKGALEQGGPIWYPRPSESAVKKIAYVLTMIDKGFVVIAEASDDGSGRWIVGACGMSFSQDAWSDDWSLVNEFIFVHRDYRDTEVAANLMSAVEMFAETQVDARTGTRVSVPIVMGVMTGESAELKDELLRRRGYVYIGGNYLRAPHVQEKENDDDPNASVTGLAGGGESTGDAASEPDS